MEELRNEPLPVWKSVLSAQAEGLTCLHIGPKQQVVGMMDLETVFRQLLALGRPLEDVTAAEIVDMARRSNYIPNRPEVEADYAEALREAYARHVKREKARAQRPLQALHGGSQATEVDRC